MKIWSYCITFPDDRDVILDAIHSLERFSDRIFVVDGGFDGALCHHPRYTEPLVQFFDGYFGGHNRHVYGLGTRYGYSYDNDSIILYENPFKDPGTQRNWITKKMESIEEQPDWYVWIDADEVCSDQMANGIREYLGSLSPEYTNVVMQWLNLCQDEQHIAGGNHSSWLAHGRAYRPRTIYWQAGWHEHQYYQGDRIQWDVRVVHTRALYRRRLLVQRGHPRVGGTDNPLWGDVDHLDPIPAGITWPALHWPKDERIIPFESDARDYWSV